MRVTSQFLSLLLSLPMLLLAGCPVAGPKADFSATPLTGNAPVTVAFTDESVVPSGASPTYRWNFGDGTESSVSSPSHTYETAGEYTVTLTVTTGNGSDVERKTGHITVLPPSGDSLPVAFGDANLEAEILRALGISEDFITVGEARGVVALQFVDVIVADLDGLQYFTSLETLRISGGYDGETALGLSPLADLVNLRELYLDGAGIVDLTPLADLESLAVLQVYDNFIDDLGPLSGLTALDTLYLYNNEITDLSPLANLANLTDLNLFGNFIVDATPLAGLDQLQILYLDNNQLTDIGPLENLTNLRSLYLGLNAISDVSPLATLTNLNALGLNENQITDIQPLADLTNLTAMFLDDNPLTADSACPVIQSLIGAGTEVYHALECAKAYPGIPGWTISEPGGAP
jgi:PKD repeat protein